MKPVRREVQIDADGTTVPGILDLPAHATGLVLFAHGSGSSRHSPRNRLVAEVLVARGIGTLLLDLLTEAEGAQRDCVFDIELLGRRLEAAMRWVTAQAGAGRLPLGLFGASTGGAAALVAAARSPELVAAVVLRGGRPDLAGDQIPLVRAPTLLIVGGEDEPVLALHRRVLPQFLGVAWLVVIPGATHLFEEPGALEEVARLAAEWFRRHVEPASPA